MKTNYLWRKLGLTLAIILTFGYSAIACNYQLKMIDSYGDGWNGGKVTVYVNGVAVLTDQTMLSGAGPVFVSFSVSTGDSITTAYTAGNWSYENEYYILDANGTTVASQGTGGTTPGNITIPLIAACPVANDASITEIIVQQTASTNDVKAVLKNVGTSTLTSATINWSVDGTAQTAYSWTGSLAQTASDTVTLGSYTFTVGSHTLVASSSTPNGVADGNTANDTATLTASFIGIVNSFPFNEGFSTGNGYFTLADDIQSSASIDTSLGNPGSAILLTGGASTGWSTYSNVTAAFGNTTHVSSATATVDASALAFVVLEFDLKQKYTYNTNYGWFRVMINGTDYAKDLNGDSVWHASTANGDPFQRLEFNLTQYAGTTFTISLQLAAKYNDANYSGSYGDDAIIDNIKIYEPAANDLQLHALVLPASGFEMDSTMDIFVKILNKGTAAQSGFDIAYSIDGGTTFTTQTIAGSLASGNDSIYQFTTQANMNALGTYNMVLYVDNTGDADSTNDTLYTAVDNLALPYNDDFESSMADAMPDYWSKLNTTASTFAYVKVYNYSYYAHSGSKSLKLYNYNNTSGDLMAVMPAVYSGVSTKVIKFWHRGYNNVDLIVGLMSDPNDATTFVAIDTILPIDGSYHQYAVSFNGYTGNAKYIAFKHGMNGTYKSLYIDDIEMYEPLPNEMMMLSWDAPLSSIEKDTADIVVSVVNNGIAAQQNIPVAYSVDAGTTIIYDTIAATINPGDTLQFTFSTPAVFASGLNYCGAAVLNGDAVPSNDTVFATVTNYPMPYITGFEDAISGQMPDGWIELNETSYGYAQAYNSIYAAHNGSFSLRLYNSGTTTGNLIAIMPEYGGDTISDKWVRFWHRGYNNVDLIVGLMSDPNDATTFVAIDTILPIDGSYHQYAVGFNGYTGNAKYIAFKHGMNANYRTLYIDDLVLEVAPTTPILGINPDSLYTFPSVRYNYPDTITQTIVISNDGIGTLNISLPVLGGVNDTNFVVVDTNTYPKVLGQFESLTFDVRFFGSSVGSRSAYIAVNSDTLLLNGDVVDPIISSFPYVENFDDQALDMGWSLIGGSYKWQYANGSTPTSNTGPLGDVTGGYYIYTEASSGLQGSVASIYTNPIDMSSLSSAQLKFWYHMYGADIDTLSIELAQNGTWTVVDTLIGQQQTASSDPWILRTVDLSAYSSTLIDSIRFRAVKGSSYAGDIAIDNIAFGQDFTINLGADTVSCDTLAVTLDAGTGTTAWTYEWIDVVSGTVLGTAQTLDVTTSGVYAVNVYDAGYFNGTDTISVLFDTPPVAIMSPDTTICEGDSINISAGASSNNTGGVFFSEYIEGYSNNKALEIYNGTSATINLDEYSIMTNYNGNPWSGQYHFPAGATLAAGDVFVLANQGADSMILAVADDALAYNAGGYVVGFNGDDVRALYHKTSPTDSVIIDIIGLYNLTDPGSGWSVAGVADATKNHTLVRKASVVSGDTSWAAIAGSDSLSSQYLVYAVNDFSHLGSHTVGGGSSSGNLTYLWSTGATTPSITVMPTTTTTYTVVVDNGNCQTTDSVVVTVNPLPIVNLGPDTSFKWTWESITLDAGNPNATFVWSTGGTAQTELLDSNNLSKGANTVYVVVTDNGCSASDTVVVTVIDDVSINGAIDNMNIEIYPNPTSGQFNMAINGFEGEIEMTIVDLAGQVVYSERINLTSSYIRKFNVSEFATGVYYIKLTTKNGIKVQKLIVQ